MSADAKRGLAIVTGAAGGLGTRIATRLAADGHSLLLVDLDPHVADVAAGFERAEACVADLTEDAGVAEVVEVAGAHGGVAALVNNAGITRDGRLGKMEESEFAAVIEVNLVAAIRIALGLEDLFLNGSAIVNISSRASLANFGQANYTTSKSGLVGVTRALALRWAPRVRANAVAPSLVDTPMTQAMPPQVLAKLVAKIPAGRIGTPEDVAALVSFLVSPESAYVTGQLVLACGGRSLAA